MKTTTIPQRIAHPGPTQNAALRMSVELRRALRVVCAQRDETFEMFVTNAIVDRLARIDANAAAPFIDR